MKIENEVIEYKKVNLIAGDSGTGKTTILKEAIKDLKVCEFNYQNMVEELSTTNPKALASLGEFYRLIHGQDFDETKLLENGCINIAVLSKDELRCAALSMFLCLYTGSLFHNRCLVFDEPELPFNSLKMLSFFDILREVHLNSHMRIFFVLSDTGNSHLFRKKFMFLGDDFKLVDTNNKPTNQQ
jgi:hypothetical protein